MDGIKTPAARAALPAPRASHVPARRVPPAAARFLLPRSATYPMVLRCRSLDQSWHGPSAYSTRISSAPKPATGSGRRSLEILPKRAAPAPSPRKGQWLQSPSRTLCRRLPEFDLNSAEFLSSPSCTRASTSPMTPPSRPTNATAETRFSLVALHAKDTHVKSHSRPQDRPRHPGAAGSVHPTRQSGGGGPCSCMRLPHCSPLGISWGPTPQSSPQSTSLSR